MKTEREIILAALRRAYASKPSTVEAYEDLDPSDEQRQYMKPGEISVNDGYGGFVVALSFDDDGNLTKCAAWE